MIKLYICCLVLIIGSVEVGLDIDMKFHQEVMEIVSYDTYTEYIVRKNMWIMFERLYKTHSGSVQFLKHDLHIFALFLNVIKVLNNSSLPSFFVVPAKGSTSPIIKRQEHIN